MAIVRPHSAGHLRTNSYGPGESSPPGENTTTDALHKRAIEVFGEPYHRSLVGDNDRANPDVIRRLTQAIYEVRMRAAIMLLGAAGFTEVDLAGLIALQPKEKLSALQRIYINSRRDLDTCTTLNLDPDQLTQKWLGAFHPIPQSFNGRLFCTFPPELSAFLSVTEINADGNGISLSSADIRALSQLSSLERLSLSRNNITAVPDAINGLRKLTYLDVSFNRIHEVSQLFSVEELDLSSNPLDTLPIGLQVSTSLRVLTMRNLPLFNFVENWDPARGKLPKEWLSFRDMILGMANNFNHGIKIIVDVRAVHPNLRPLIEALQTKVANETPFKLDVLIPNVNSKDIVFALKPKGR